MKKLLSKILVLVIAFTFMVGDVSAGYLVGEVNLIVDGNMETAGMGDWGAVYDAVLTKETASPHRGTQILRIAYGGTSSPSAQQLVVLIIGKSYRVTGWGRGDGTFLPRFIGANQALWSGTSSTDWQYFDVIFTAINNTSIALKTNAISAGYAEFDDIRVVEYHGTPTGGVTVMTDGNMEKAGTTDWSGWQSATLSKENTSPQRGSQNLKVLYSSTATCYAIQTNALTVGETYRVTGWARSDGNRSPTVATSAATHWTGSTSVNWQWMDTIFTNTGDHRIFLGAGGASAGQYTEWDDIRIEVYKGTPTSKATILVDGNMETAGVADWAVGASATLTKDTTSPHRGSQALRVAYNGTANPFARQAVLTVGETYRATGFARGDGTYIIVVAEGNNILWTGTTSTSWQFFDVAFTATSITRTFRLYSCASAAGYAEFDDVRVELVE